VQVVESEHLSQKSSSHKAQVVSSCENIPRLHESHLSGPLVEHSKHSLTLHVPSTHVFSYCEYQRSVLHSSHMFTSAEHFRQPDTRQLSSKTHRFEPSNMYSSLHLSQPKIPLMMQSAHWSILQTVSSHSFRSKLNEKPYSSQTVLKQEPF